MPAAGEVTSDAFFPDNFFDEVYGLDGSRIHATRLLLTIHGDQLVHSQLQAGQNHASVPRAGAPADTLGFQQRDARSVFRQRPGGRKPGEARAYDGYVCTV